MTETSVHIDNKIKKLQETIDKCANEIEKLFKEKDELFRTDDINIEMSDTTTIYIRVVSDKVVYYNKYTGKVPKFILNNNCLYHLGYNTGFYGLCYIQEGWSIYDKKKPIINSSLIKKIYEITSNAIYIGEKCNEPTTLTCLYD